MLILLLVLALVARARNYALLVNTSKNYSNYRHMADLLALNSILTSHGFTPRDILALFQEDPIQNARNPHGEQIIFHDGETVDYARLEPTKLDSNYLMNVLLLRHDKLKFLDENDNLLIFMCGHGKDGFLKICDMQYLFRGDIMRILTSICKRVSKVLLMIDTCGAESLVDRGRIPGNAFIVTTSLADESAYSVEVDRRLGVAPINAFPYELHRTRLVAGMRLVDLFAELKYRVADSTLTYSHREDFRVDEFFMQSGSRDRRVRAFAL